MTDGPTDRQTDRWTDRERSTDTNRRTSSFGKQAGTSPQVLLKLGLMQKGDFASTGLLHDLEQFFCNA